MAVSAGTALRGRLQGPLRPTPGGRLPRTPGKRGWLGLGEYALRAPFRPGPRREEALIMVGTIRRDASIDKHPGVQLRVVTRITRLTRFRHPMVNWRLYGYV